MIQGAVFLAPVGFPLRRAVREQIRAEFIALDDEAIVGRADGAPVFAGLLSCFADGGAR